MRQIISDPKNWTVAVLGYSTHDNVKVGDELIFAKPLSADLLLVQTFVQIFGLRARISFSRDKQYGVLLPNNTWTGLIGLVQRKVWNCLLWTLIAEILICIIMKGIAFDLLYSNFHPITCFIKILLKQDFKFPKTKYHCMSIFLAFWLIGCSVLGQYYGGTLTSSTSISKTEEIVEDWGDLSKAVAKGEIFACGIKGSNTHNWLLETKDKKFGIIKEAIKKNPSQIPETQEEFIPRLLKGTHTLIITDFSSKIFILRNGLRTSGLYLSEEFSGIQMKSIAFEKGASFREEFDQMTLELKEAGILQLWNSRSVLGAELKQQSSDSSENYISLTDIKQLLFLLSILHALSIFVFLVEQLLLLLLFLKQKTIT